MGRRQKHRTREPQEDSGTTKGTELRPTDSEPLSAGPTHEPQRHPDPWLRIGMSNSEPWRISRIHTQNSGTKRYCGQKQSNPKTTRKEKESPRVRANQQTTTRTTTKTQDKNLTRQNPHEKRREKESETTSTSMTTGGVSTPATVTDGTGTSHQEEHPSSGWQDWGRYWWLDSETQRHTDKTQVDPSGPFQVGPSGPHKNNNYQMAPSGPFEYGTQPFGHTQILPHRIYT